MIGYSYTYKSSQEVIESITHLSSVWITDILLIFWVCLFMLLNIFLIIPLSVITHEYIQEKKIKLSKKKLLTQILLQKEIEDEVEKEIEIESEASLT